MCIIMCRNTCVCCSVQVVWYWWRHSWSKH